MAGSDAGLNNILQNDLYFCENPGKTPVITLTSRSLPLDFIAPKPAAETDDESDDEPDDVE